MIILENVSKAYLKQGRWHWLLKEASCVFQRGKSVALIGREEEAGSMLMRLISGQERPSKGRVRRLCRISWGLGLGCFHAKLTGVENAKFACRIYGVDPPKVLNYVHSFTELGSALEKPMGTYSKEMRLKFALGVSLGLQFDFYLVDDLRAGSDARLLRRFREELKRAFRSSDVILASQTQQNIFDFCSHGVVLHEGRLSEVMEIEKAMLHYDKLVGI